MNAFKEALTIGALLVGAAAAVVYLNGHVSWGCLLGTCAVITH